VTPSVPSSEQELLIISLLKKLFLSVVTFSREKVQCEIMLALLMFQTVKMFHGIFSFITTENSLQARGKNFLQQKKKRIGALSFIKN
jgi:hypothetical protein